MDRFPVVVIGASAGGVTALRTIVAGLEPDIAASIFIVLHIGARNSVLPEVLNSAGPIPAKHAEHGEQFHPGQIHIAPPDYHMLLSDGHVHLTRGPKENWARPAIDPLFRSAAESCGENVIGVILSGNMNDGTLGLGAIKDRNGIAIVQDPQDADNPDMPRSALSHVKVNYCTKVAEIPHLLNRLVAERQTASTTSQRVVERPTMTNGETFDRPVAVTCPDCGGALRRNEIGTLVEYRCHIQHVYTAEVLTEVHFDQMEKVLRAGERIVHERAELCRQMAERAIASGATEDVERWQSAGEQAFERAHELRDFIEQDWLSPGAVANLK